MAEHMLLGPKDARQRHIMGVLMMLGAEDFNAGKTSVLVPLPLAMKIGLLPGPDDRLAAVRDARKCMAAVDAAEEMTREQTGAAADAHASDCDGCCGPIYFYTQVIEMITQLIQTPEQAVDTLLSELGVPHGDHAGDHHV